MVTLISLAMNCLNGTCHAITNYNLYDPDLQVVDCVSPRTWISPLPPQLLKSHRSSKN